MSITTQTETAVVSSVKSDVAKVDAIGEGADQRVRTALTRAKIAEAALVAKGEAFARSHFVWALVAVGAFITGLIVGKLV